MTRSQATPASSQIITLERMLQEREAEIDRGVKDAERYRFIRTRPQWLGWGEDFDPRDIDAIVDRAMQGEKS